MTIEPRGRGPRRGARGRGRALTGLAAAVLLVAVGCGDDDDGGEAASGTTASTAAGGDDYGGSGGGDGGGDSEAGTIVAVDFELSSTTVGAGDEVTFRNDDGTAHTVTADDATFDTGPVAAGDAATFTAPATPGEVAFHCDIHPSMTGTLTVEG